MPGLRIRHLMLAVVAAAFYFLAWKLDDGCTGLFFIVTFLYACAILGEIGARRRGRPPWSGVLLGMILGPIGTILACSQPVPKDWPPRRARETAARSPD